MHFYVKRELDNKAEVNQLTTDTKGLPHRYLNVLFLFTQRSRDFFQAP